MKLHDLFFILCFFILQNFPAYGQDTIAAQFTILEYGFPQSDKYYDARAIVDEKWHIDYKRISGCSVPKDLEDSVQRINDSTYQKIEDLYGKNWETNYNAEITAIYDQIMEEFHTIKSILQINDEIALLKEVTFNAKNEKIILKFSPLNSNHSLNGNEIDTNTDMNHEFSIQNLNDTNLNQIYLGYTNIFQLLPEDLKHVTVFDLICKNCTILSLSNLDTIQQNLFAINPTSRFANNKTAQLYIGHGKNIPTVINFNIGMLPIPRLFLNEYTSGDKVNLQSIDTLNLYFAYTKNISFKLSSQVTSWQIVSDCSAKVMSGIGNSVDKKTVKFLKKLKSGCGLNVICTVVGSDCIARKIAAAYIIE